MDSSRMKVGKPHLKGIVDQPSLEPALREQGECSRRALGVRIKEEEETTSHACFT